MSDCCKDVVKGASKSNDNTLEVIEQLQTRTADNTVSVCANCGKEGTNINNICNKCKQVKYCNAACKKKHRHKHKKDCEDHLKQITDEHDEELFKEPPPKDGDCPICFLRIPSIDTGGKYMSCCGKIICSGCAHAPVFDNQGNEVNNQKCAFCRTPLPTSDEGVVQINKKRVAVDDAIAINCLGFYYYNGKYGFPKDQTKALELYHRAAELGYAKAYTNVGCAYELGHGVEVDEEKATHYYELAAMRGDERARYNLGNEEIRAGNYDRALKHYVIAAGSGYADSLDAIKQMYTKGDATKEDYTKALQSYQTYLGEIKSKQRDEAAAFDSEEYQYY